VSHDTLFSFLQLTRHHVFPPAPKRFSILCTMLYTNTMPVSSKIPMLVHLATHM